MYEILLDGKSLYYPGDIISAVTEAKITEELNDSGYMDINVPPINPLYGYIYERKSVITVKKDSSVIWEGEVVDISENMKKEKKLYVVGDMSYLNDSIQEKREYSDKTVIQILGELVNEHNSQVESRKQFVVGVVTIDVPEGMMNLETNYESTLSVIREKICNEYDGYTRIRWVDGIRYLDIVKIEDYGNTCLQPIQFGRNLLDYAKNLTAENVVTCIIPLGEEAEDETFLTIKSVNNGLNYIFNQEAVDSFGWIRRVVKFPDITDAETLLEEGNKWLKQNQYAKLTIEVNAVDLSLLKSNMDSFNLGDYVNVKAKPFGLDVWYYIRQKETDLLHPDSNTITIGDTIPKSYTQQIKQEVGKLEKEIPSANKILLAAKQNASNLIKAATTGFVVLNMDENGNPKELLIMDTPDIETAKKVWRWNVNGLGYSSEGYNGEYGLAMTMDGAIVADFITAGTMIADRIKGGTLSLGGENNANGVLNILDSKGNLIGKWDNAGIILNGGSINIGNNFIVDAAGNVTSKHLTAATIKSAGNVSFEATDTENGGIYSNANLYVKKNITAGGGLTANGSLYVKGSGTVEGAMAVNGGNLTTLYHLYAYRQAVFGSESYGFPYKMVMDTENGFFRPSSASYMSNIGSNDYPWRDGYFYGTVFRTNEATYSSKRIKDNIIPMSEEEADKILDLEVTFFDYKDKNRGVHIPGLIAEKVFDVLPNIVVGNIHCDDKDAYKIGIDYEKIIPYLIKKLQMQEKRIKVLEERLGDSNV